jgi:hypothetical protein
MTTFDAELAELTAAAERALEAFETAHGITRAEALVLVERVRLEQERIAAGKARQQAWLAARRARRARRQAAELAATAHLRLNLQGGRQ